MNSDFQISKVQSYHQLPYLNKSFDEGPTRMSIPIAPQPIVNSPVSVPLPTIPVLSILQSENKQRDLLLIELQKELQGLQAENLFLSQENDHLLRKFLN